MQIVAWSLMNQTEQILPLKKLAFKGYYKSIAKGTETWGQKLWQLYHLQFDAAETCQSRPLARPDYCE